MIKCLSQKHESHLILISGTHIPNKPDVVANTCNPSFKEVRKAWASVVSQSGVIGEIQAKVCVCVRLKVCYCTSEAIAMWSLGFSQP